jgi:hypothetical protein
VSDVAGANQLTSTFSGLNTSAAAAGSILPQASVGPTSGNGAGPSPSTSTPEQDLKRHDLVRQGSLARSTSLPAIVKVEGKLREVSGQDERWQLVMSTAKGLIKRVQAGGLQGLRVYLDKSYITKHQV